MGERLKGSLEFEDVEMRYQVHLEPALKNLSFTIKEGERVAVVGRTGAGKSSFFQLLQGFRECCSGRIVIDGKNITTCPKSWLRKSINVVLQNPYINENESIRVNLVGINADETDRLDASRSSKLGDGNLRKVMQMASLSDISLDDKAAVLSGG